jgi:hypothetical protein
MKVTSSFFTGLLQYSLVNKGYTFAFDSRFGDETEWTPKYKEWRQMWENFKSNKGPRPPPYKEFTNQPKTTYNLAKAVSKMIDSLLYEKSYYHQIIKNTQIFTTHISLTLKKLTRNHNDNLFDQPFS